MNEQMKAGNFIKVIIFLLFVFIAVISVPFALNFKSLLPFSGGLHGHFADRPIDDFILISAEGKEISLQSHKGKFRLVFFGFTRCTTACPAALQTFMKLDRILKDDKSVLDPLYYFITVDPAFDQVHHLHDFFRNFPSHYIGLTGTTEQILNVQNVFQIPVAMNPDHHTTALFVIDPENVLSIVYHDIPDAVRIKDDITKIKISLANSSNHRLEDICIGR